MRIEDFLEPHLDGVSLVIERHSGALSLEPYLSLPDGVAYQRSRTDPRPGPSKGTARRPSTRYPPPRGPRTGSGALRGRGRSARAARRSRDSAAVRDRVRLSDSGPSRPLAARRADGLWLSEAVQLSSLEHQHLHAAAMAVQVGDGLTIPRDPFGRQLVPERVGGPEAAVLRRLASEFVLLDFVARNLRAQVFRLGGSSVEGPDAVPGGTSSNDGPSSAGAGRAGARRRGRHDRRATGPRRGEAARAEADELRREAARLNAEVDRISRSTSFLLGRTFVETARRPANAPRLPLDLVRLWRRRGLSADHSRTVASPGVPAFRLKRPRGTGRITIPCGERWGHGRGHAGLSRTWPSRCSRAASGRRRHPHGLDGECAGPRRGGESRRAKRCTSW